MRILLFLRDALPPSRVDVRVLFDRALRECGIDTDYVGSRHAHGTVPDGDTVCRGAMFEAAPPGKRPRWWRALAVLWRQAASYDLVIVRDQPLLGALILTYSRLRGRKTAYWMSFPIPLGDRTGARAHWQHGWPGRAAWVWSRGAIAEIVQRMLTLRVAQRVFVQSERMRDVIVRTGVPRERVDAVPMGVDSALLHALAADDPRAPVECCRIAYLGALTRARRLDVLLDALAEVLPRYPDARLMLVGGSDNPADVAWLRAHAARRRIDHALEIVPPRPMLEAWSLVRAAAVAVSPIPPGPLHDVSSPTKLVEYLALGVPVVASRIPDQEAVLRDCGGGICVDFDARQFAGALCTILQDVQNARAEARRAREKVLALRSYEVLAQGLAGRLRALAAG